MRKGKDRLTYGQLGNVLKQLQKENAALRRENAKLRADLHSRTVAFNRLLKGGDEG